VLRSDLQIIRLGCRVCFMHCWFVENQSFEAWSLIGYEVQNVLADWHWQLAPRAFKVIFTWSFTVLDFGILSNFIFISQYIEYFFVT
jgi:hypothetical protein